MPEDSVVLSIKKAISAAVADTRSRWGPGATVVATLLASLAFWAFLVRYTSWSPALFVSLSLASFMVGCAGGFVLTSYGDEAATVGKIRDWLIGGFAGLTVAKFGALKALLLTFAAGAGPQPYALVISVSGTYAILGFFLMFFQRELILNVLLAESRDRRGKVEGTRAAGLITHQLLSSLPPSLLTGIDDLEDLAEVEAGKMRSLLGSENVKKFLSQAEQASVVGQLDWDVVSKAAILHYYLVYIAVEKEKQDQVGRALDWVERALIMNPGHADLTAKYADLLATSGSYVEAILTLERLDQSPESPAYIRQWLGYYLLKIPDRVDEAIRYSEEFHARFPDGTSSLYNAARGYAQKYAAVVKRLADNNTPELSGERDGFRRKVLDRIGTAFLNESPSELPESKKWVRDNADFGCLASDPEFMKLVAD